MDYNLDQITILFDLNPEIKNVEDALEKLEKKALGFEHKFAGVPGSIRCQICNYRR